MSIANNIDGSSGGANQLLDLLSVVSNPKVYEAKIKSLQDATDEYNKAIALAGPASEILELREKTAKLLDKAENTLSEAEAQALQTVNDAKRKADAIMTEAKSQAQQLENKAKELVEDAKQRASEASLAETVANATKVELDKKLLDLDAKMTDVQAAEQAANDSKAMFDKAYSNIIAKHKAFIESL